MFPGDDCGVSCKTENGTKVGCVVETREVRGYSDCATVSLFNA